MKRKIISLLHKCQTVQGKIQHCRMKGMAFQVAGICLPQFYMYSAPVIFSFKCVHTVPAGSIHNLSTGKIICIKPGFSQNRCGCFGMFWLIAWKNPGPCNGNPSAVILRLIRPFRLRQNLYLCFLTDFFCPYNDFSFAAHCQQSCQDKFFYFNGPVILLLACKVNQLKYCGSRHCGFFHYSMLIDIPFVFCHGQTPLLFSMPPGNHFSILYPCMSAVRTDSVLPFVHPDRRRPVLLRCCLLGFAGVKYNMNICSADTETVDSNMKLFSFWDFYMLITHIKGRIAEISKTVRLLESRHGRYLAMIQRQRAFHQGHNARCGHKMPDILFTGSDCAKLSSLCVF